MTTKPAQPAVSAATDDSLHILVIEDDLRLRQTVVDALREDGHFVAATADGAEALEWLDEAIPDVVLLDMVMPHAKVDGFEFIARLGTYPPAVSQIPLVLTSALGPSLAEAVDTQSAALLNIVAILPKPLDLARLLYVTRAAGARRR